MNLKSKKRTMLNASIATFVIALAIVNYMQLNSNSDGLSLSVIKDANADVTCYSANTNCYWGTTSDGVPHYITNAEGE